MVLAIADDNIKDNYFFINNDEDDFVVHSKNSIINFEMKNRDDAINLCKFINKGVDKEVELQDKIKELENKLNKEYVKSMNYYKTIIAIKKCNETVNEIIDSSEFIESLIGDI